MAWNNKTSKLKFEHAQFSLNPLSSGPVQKATSVSQWDKLWLMKLLEVLSKDVSQELQNAEIK